MTDDVINIETLKKKKFILLFDGVCNLCNRAVHFIIKNEAKDKFLFSALQNPEIVQYLKHQKNHLKDIDALILITDTKIYTKSSAALIVAKHLKGLYPLLFVCYIIPKPLRDTLYDFIAKNRYRWFGKKNKCGIEIPEFKSKFL
ncbi:MAG: thiol-disulfide oxidoreductase DCC family protein [Wenyingzhuangia sp.]